MIQQLPSYIYIDSHCHLDLYPDYPHVIKRIEQHNVLTIAVSNTPSVFKPLASIAAASELILPALGLHPQLVAERHKELPVMWEHFDSTRFIGEVGLDFARGSSSDHSLQRKVFEEIIGRCDTAGDKILTVHSRKSAEDVLSIIGEHFKGTVILHWYSGSLKTLEKAMANGYYFSVNSAMLKSKNGMAIISRIPHDRIITETDGPFIKINGRSAEPKDIENIIAPLAGLWNTSIPETITLIQSNFNLIVNNGTINYHF
jgi:TatD DNase family protein